jgi:uncharacterized protein YacL
MLRGLIGFILGMICGVFTISSCHIPEYLIFWIVIDVIVLTVLLIWCHKHHIKKRDEYHDKIRGRFKYRG